MANENFVSVSVSKFSDAIENKQVVSMARNFPKFFGDMSDLFDISHKKVLKVCWNFDSVRNRGYKFFWLL